MSALSTAANPSAYDPLERMDPEEGRFVIRESDPAGPAAMTEWARTRRNQAFKLYGTDPKGKEAKRLLDAELLQCRDAENLALEWRARQTESGVQPLAVKALYQAVERTEGQVAAERRKKSLAAFRQALSEAAYFGAEVLEEEGAEELNLYAPLLALHNVVRQAGEAYDSAIAGQA